MKGNLVLVLAIFFYTSIQAQERAKTNTHPTQSVDGIVKEVLKIISGEQGKTRDWDTFRNLFLPTATLSVLNHGDSIPMPFETVALEEFIELMQDEYYQQGFVEYETGKIVNEFNGLANVFQSFYARDSENVEEKGINSYQLVYYDDRWRIANLIWTGSSDGVEIPEEYLKD